MVNKKSKGQQKISMRRIENEENRLTTFSKRRNGIYTKATEISTLCGAEVGILMFSPAGKPFAYGVSSIESVANKLMSRSGLSGGDCSSEDSTEASRRARLDDLNKRFDERSAYLKQLKEEGDQLAKEAKEKQKEAGEDASSWWWDFPLGDLKEDEMDQMKVMMEAIKKNATNRIQELVGGGKSENKVVGDGVKEEVVQTDMGGYDNGGVAAISGGDNNLDGSDETSFV